MFVPFSRIAILIIKKKYSLVDLCPYCIVFASRLVFVESILCMKHSWFWFLTSTRMTGQAGRLRD